MTSDETTIKSQLSALVDDYLVDCESDFFDGSYKNNLIEFLRNHDCRAILSSAVDGDAFAEMFTYTAYYNHLHLLEACVEQGIYVDIQSTRNKTALIYSCTHDYFEGASYLLEHHANVDFQEHLGHTALMHASNLSRIEIVRLLLKHNADIDLKDNNGQTALDMARNEETQEMLLNHVSNSYVLK